MQVPTAFRALQGAANALSMLEAGFTTVRDVGNGGLYSPLHRYTAPMEAGPRA